jgi:hypothetical protein
MLVLPRLPKRLLLPICLLALPALLNACSGIIFRSSRDWMSLSSPPSGAAVIVGVRDVEVWVETNDGALFTTSIYPTCEPSPDCQQWMPVEKLPFDPANLEPNDRFTPTRGSECGGLQPGNPAPNPDGNLLECVFVLRPAGETFEYFYFALMSDGTIMYLDNTPVGIPWIFH